MGNTAAPSLTTISDIISQAFAGFDACLPQQSALTTGETVIVAVSGGSDSIALLLLIQRYLQKKRPDCRLVAVTIDHRLRAESAYEAADVGAFCENLGIDHQTLCWEGAKPATGVASAARSARYDLLVKAARQNAATVILTGHSADDQVETYLMRAQRVAHQSGDLSEGRGLAAMATQTLLQNSVLLCRPLLKIWREALRDFLRSENIGWFDDPSNINLVYERPRIRAFASTINKQAVFDAAAMAAHARRADNHAIALMLSNEDNQIKLFAGDRLALPRGWDVASPATTPLALGYLLAAIGGKAFLPSLSDCVALAEWLDNASTGTKQRRTLHHCVIEKTIAGVSLWRERRNLPIVDVTAGESILWDGRYCITNISNTPITIAALNAQQLSDYMRLHNDEGQKLQRDALLSSPAIMCDGELKEFPCLSYYAPNKSGAVSHLAPNKSGAGLHLASQKPVAGLKRHFACFDRVLSGHDFEVARGVKALLTMPFNHKYK